MNPTIALACELIRCRSVTPADAGCQDILIGRLEALGFQVTRLPFGEVSNFWAERPGDGPLFCFAGHTDVVPAGDESVWQSDPFAPHLDAGILRGRGAADMKGSLAAMITALEEFLAAHPEPRGRIALLITSDEEGPAVDGTVRVVDWLQAQGKYIDYCVVGEPSSDRVTGDLVRIGRRGSLGGTLTVRGVQGHVAYPDQARNPIHEAARALAELAATHWDDGTGEFPPTTFQVSNIGAGTGATNVIPGTLQAHFNFRFSPAQSEAGLRARSEEILARHCRSFEVDWSLSGQPFVTAGGRLIGAVQAAVQSVCGMTTELSTGGGTSDGRFIAPTGTELVELGPPNATIHKVDEQVRTADLETLHALYVDILRRMLT